ncbi:DUF7473 family protein [Halegenticoccus tardaugens]|uniref:DUF7473 family protein n=1 Tax=Halegenticoccus tardaugens TaxID=2071624 RepID=UPI00100AAFEA|nr:hypothetical protein [Halegenticoccus tardaugens]
MVVTSPLGPVGLQTEAVGSPLAIAGTFGLFALFLTLTAHIAARNVLGDVEVKKAFAVGPVPAAVGVAFTALGVNSLLSIAVALVADAGMIRYLYGRSLSLTAYVTFIHAVVTVILGTVLFGLFFLASTAPT